MPSDTSTRTELGTPHGPGPRTSTRHLTPWAGSSSVTVRAAASARGPLTVRGCARARPHRRARRAALPCRRPPLSCAGASARRSLARRLDRLRAASSQPPLVVGGRSSGARVACRTAEPTRAVGVLCLAFPLGPPRRVRNGAPSRLPELEAVAVPTLVVQGVRDPFGMPPPGCCETSRMWRATTACGATWARWAKRWGLARRVLEPPALAKPEPLSSDEFAPRACRPCVDELGGAATLDFAIYGPIAAATFPGSATASAGCSRQAEPTSCAATCEGRPGRGDRGRARAASAGRSAVRLPGSVAKRVARAPALVGFMGLDDVLLE